MAEYHGDIRLGDTIDIKFTTVGTTGAPTQLAGTPVISAYVGNGTTEITAGITLTVDFDGRTGYNNVRVVASSGNGFATATNVDLCITTGTVGGTSVVGYSIGSFSIENRSAVMPTTAARTLDVSAAGNAGIDWSNIEAPTTAQNLSGTNIDTDQVVASVTGAVGSVTGAVGSVTGNVGGNVTGSVGSVAAGGIASTSFAAGAIDAAAIAANAIGASELAADAAAEIAAAVRTELTVELGRVDAAVSTRASQVSVDDLPTNAELATALAAADDAVLAAIAALNNLSAAQVATELADALGSDTYAEPGQGTPAATLSIAGKIGYLYKAWRNRHTQTASEYALYADDGVTKDQEAAVSDDGTTFERGEVATGA